MSAWCKHQSVPRILDISQEIIARHNHCSLQSDNFLAKDNK